MLEELFNRWPDIPRPLMMKIELFRLGVRTTDAALKATVDLGLRLPKRGGAGIFTHETDTSSFEKRFERAEARGGGIGNIAMRDGTGVMIVENEGSPYSIDYVDDKFFVCDEGKPIEECKVVEEPLVMSMRLEDGTPVRWLCLSPCHVYGLTICEIWALDPCKFCDINRTAARWRNVLGDAYKTQHDPEQVAEVVEMGFRYSDVRSYFLGGGTHLKPFRGKKDADVCSEFLRAILGRVPSKHFPGTVQTIAWPIEEIQKIYETGVTSWQPNIEVWDPTLWKILCPGKDKVVGRDEWIRRTVKAVDLFGEGYVNPNFVTGVELCKPYGFKSADAAVKSTLEGFEYLMSKGVVPRMHPWNREPQSPLCHLAQQEPPPTEYYVGVEQGWWELLQRYGLFEPAWMAGGSNTGGFSLISDWRRQEAIRRGFA